MTGDRRSPYRVLGLLLAAAMIPAAAARPDTPPPTRPVVEHLADRAVAEVDATRVIAFRVAAPPDADCELDADVADPGVLAVVRPPTVLGGESIGYARVLGVAAGRTRLAIAGRAIDVDVSPRREEAARHAPRIVGPASGAVVWGEIAVGVEVRLRPNRPLRAIRLRLGDGRVLEPVDDTGLEHQPMRQVVFAMDAGDARSGPFALEPVAVDEDGTERTGPTVRVLVTSPQPNALVTGEAERRYEIERPQRFRDDRVQIGSNDDASEGRFFVNASPYPAFCFPLRVHESGWYQIALRAAGTRAQGVLPTVGIVVDGANVSTTNARLLRRGFHRFAAGVPIRLEEGEHVLTPYFANDFYVDGRVDRNLFLDCIEVLRVAEPGLSDPLATAPGPLRIGLARPLDGQILPGLLEVEGRCWWIDAERTPAPDVTLLVNDRPAGEQRSGAPRFWIDPSFFEPGENRIQLVARAASGQTAATPVQTMHWPEAAGQDRLPPRRHRRFTAHDERWDPGIAGMLDAVHRPKERRAIAFYANGQAALALPEDLAGAHDVFVELRGTSFQGPAVATVSLRTADDATPIGTIEAPDWWNTRRAGEIELPPGPKELVIAFENDHFAADRGDRNLFVEAVLLVDRAEPDHADRTEPFAELAYPRDGQIVHMADAVVFVASDNASLANAELILDGQRTGVTVDLNLKPGRAALPLLLRDLAGGEHTVAVAVTDVAGNVAVSAPRTVRVVGETPPGGTVHARAVHLLNRFAFGPDPDELAAILVMGEQAWLADRLSRRADDAGDLAALGAALPYFVRDNAYEVPRRALAHVLLTPNPVRARFVLWAENHFSTWIRKTTPGPKWLEHVTYTRLGAAPFARLLQASCESPAMLTYLDQATSYAGRLNENYARELMELHTLGVDSGYAQADVTNLAALLTGWTVALEGDGRGGGDGAAVYSFRFDPALNDGGETRVLGVRFPAADPAGRFDRCRLMLETLAAHPSTARFVSRKLAEHYAAVPAPETLVDDLTQRYHETGGDLRELCLALAAHPAFWESRGERVAHHLDYAARVCRTTRHFNPWRVGDFLQRAGYQLFDRSFPDGYPEEDAAYTDSNAMVQRWRFASETAWPLVGLVPGAWRGGGGPPDATWRQAVVDIVAVRLTGAVLGDASNDAALALLEQTPGNRNERVQLLGPFVAALPEANLR
jgi:uncharacterized protein (DUF1800 family)